MYRRLLVAVDEGSKSRRAVEHAIDLASDFESAIEFLYVVDVRPVYSRYGLAALPTNDEIAHEEQRGRDILEQVAELASDVDVPCETTIVQGTPYLKISQQATKREVDAIVIGAPRKRHISRMLVGSTTDRVIHRVDCPVIVVQ